MTKKKKKNADFKRKVKDENDDFIEKIAKIRDRLKTETSGHINAYRHLLSDKQELERLYSKKAEEEWLKISENDKNDWIAIHHLAVMNHAKAFELELDGKSKKAKEYWKRALKFWDTFLKSPRSPKGTEAGAVESIHHLVKKMEFYKPGEHEPQFKKLTDVIQLELLGVHRFFYSHYLGKKEFEKADIHLSIVEESPFGKVKNKMIMEIYEKNYGERVARIVNDIDKQRLDELQLEFSGKIVELRREIIELSNKKKSLYIASRDIVILTSWNVQFKLIEFIHDLDKFQNSPDINRINKLTQKLNSIIEKYGLERARISNDKDFEEHEALSKTIKERETDIYKRNIGYAVQLLGSSETHITKLGHLSSVDREKAIFIMKSAIVKIEHFKNHIQGITELDEFKALLKTSKKMMDQINALDSLPGEINPSTVESRDQLNIWKMKEYSKDKIPYYDTCFLILTTEFPSMSKQIDLNKIISNMKKRKRSLEIRANAGRHQVFGRKITSADLNRFQESLKSPTMLTKDIILSHQAHHADPREIHEIKKELSGIDVPLPETVPLPLSPGIFSLFTFFEAPGKTGLSWEKVEKEPPLDQPGIKIKWPT